jgi:hypothetical protein
VLAISAVLGEVDADSVVNEALLLTEGSALDADDAPGVTAVGRRAEGEEADTVSPVS